MDEEIGLDDIFTQTLASIHARNTARAAHRLGCSVRPCKLCELWRCAQCGHDSENAPDDRDGRHRPALCETCSRQWERDRMLAPALASLPSDWHRTPVPNREGAAFMVKHAPSYLQVRKRVVAVAEGLGSCVLSGPSCAGKTLTASYMLRLVIELGRLPSATPEQVKTARDARCIPALELAAARLAHPLGKGEAPKVLEALTASVLLLDDCGQEDERGRQVVREVLMMRDRRPTWCTTFLSRDDFAARYGGGALSRLTECGTWIDMRGAR